MKTYEYGSTTNQVPTLNEVTFSAFLVDATKMKTFVAPELPENSRVTVVVDDATGHVTVTGFSADDRDAWNAGGDVMDALRKEGIARIRPQPNG